MIVCNCLAENDELWYNYLDDVAIRHFQALGASDDHDDHNLYSIDLWEELLSGKPKKHRLLALHVLIHFREKELTRIVKQLHSVDILRGSGKMVRRSSMYEADAPESPASPMSSLDLPKLAATQLRRSRAGSELSSDLSSSVSSSASVPGIDEYFSQYCELILFKLNEKLLSRCDTADSEDQTMALWADAIPGVVGCVAPTAP